MGRVSGADRATLGVKIKPNLKPIHDLSTQSQGSNRGNIRIYTLHPFQTAKPTLPISQPAASTQKPNSLPPRQPLPSAVLDPTQLSG